MERTEASGMKKLIALFVALFIAAGSVFAAAAAQGSINLKFASVTYHSRTDSGDNTFYITPAMRKWYEIKDFDIFDSFYWAFGLDTRILPDYTYHITYKIYTGEDYEDANFRYVVPSQSINFYSADDSSDVFTAYPTISVNATNTSTTVDIFMRFESGSDRGNQVSAGNYVTFGQSWDTSGLTPFDYEGIWVGLFSFEAVYDFDGEILSALTAGFSDIKRGIDGMSKSLEDISDKLDHVQDDVKQGEIEAKEWEREEANQVANDSLDDVDDSLKDVVDLTGIDRVVNSFLTIMNYEGTQLDFNMPEVKLPAIGDYIPETVLINEQSIPFETWLENVYVVKLIDVLNVLSVIGFGIWVIKQIMYWVQFFSADGDVHKLVDEGYGGSADPYA